MKAYIFLGFLFFFTALAYSSSKEIPSEEMALNVKNEKGLTPLMISVENEDSDEVAWLLKNGANPNIASDTGLTSLKIAIKNRRPMSRGGQLGEDIIPLLISNGASIDEEDRRALERLGLKKLLPPSPNLSKEDYIKQKAAGPENAATSPYEHSQGLRRHHMKYPNYKEVKKFLLDYQEPSEFTGALEWAHRKGFNGEGTRIVIMESGIDGAHTTPITITKTDLLSLAGTLDPHGIAVLNIIHRVAPAAKLFLLPVPDPKKIYDEKIFSYIKKYTTEYFTKNSIVNASFGVEYPKHYSFQPLKIWQQNTFSELLQNNCLIIQAAGNDGIPLTRSEVGEFLRDLFSQNISHALLIAGSVDPTYSIAHYSNTPGDNPIFQEKFLCTLGTNIPSMSTGRPTTPSGTSLSAPAISGVAALILSSHPTFSMEEVASTLLESAEKNFFIPSSESGNTGTFIYEDSPPSIKKKSMVYQLFDPSIYGRGILSVRRAFIYADIYEEIKKEMPTATPKKILEKTKTAFNLVIKEIDRAAATKIQTTARGFLARKKLKRVIIE